MRKMKQTFKKYRQIIWTAGILLGLYFLFEHLPYCFMEKPLIREITPNEIMVKTNFSDTNLLYLTGENLENVSGIYINGIYEKDCVIASNTQEELAVWLPGEYFLTDQKLDIQVEVRVNSDLTCLSGKNTLTILSDEALEMPVITETVPEVLGYDGDLQQEIIVRGEHFSAETTVFVNGVEYTTRYDDNAGELHFAIPYSDWCGQKELTLQVTQCYKGYPTAVTCEPILLKTDHGEREHASLNASWTKHRILADSLGEWNGVNGCNAKEAFVGNYELGQRLFGVELMFSSDGILFGKHLDKNDTVFLPHTFRKEKAMEQDYTLLSYADICKLLKEYPESYWCVKLQEADTLEALETICNYLLEETKDETLLQRLIFPVDNTESYYLLSDLYPFENMVYAPKEDTTAAEVLAFVDATGISAAFLPMDLLSVELLEQLGQRGCVVYATDVKESDVDGEFFARGIHGFVTDTIPIDTCGELVTGALKEWEEHSQIAEETLEEETEMQGEISEELSTNLENMVNYLQALDTDRYLVLMAVRDDAAYLMTAELQKKLKALGLREDLQKGLTKSYLAVIDRGEVIYEALSEEALEYDAMLEELSIHAESAGFYGGNTSSIQLDGEEYSVNGRGMNIVVYDRLLKGVMDSVCFDMFDEVKMMRK